MRDVTQIWPMGGPGLTIQQERLARLARDQNIQYPAHAQLVSDVPAAPVAPSSPVPVTINWAGARSGQTFETELLGKIVPQLDGAQLYQVAFVGHGLSAGVQAGEAEWLLIATGQHRWISSTLAMMLIKDGPLARFVEALSTPDPSYQAVRSRAEPKPVPPAPPPGRASDEERAELRGQYGRVKGRLKKNQHDRERVLSIATTLVAGMVREGVVDLADDAALKDATEEAVELATVAYYTAQDFVFG